MRSKRSKCVVKATNFVPYMQSGRMENILVHAEGVSSRHAEVVETYRGWRVDRFFERDGEERHGKSTRTKTKDRALSLAGKYVCAGRK